jgi:hypothetical protein
MKAGWVLGVIVTGVLSFAGVCQTGLLGGRSASEASAASATISQQEVFSTQAGWRYQRGQPSHWKYLVMKR